MYQSPESVEGSYFRCFALPQNYCVVVHGMLLPVHGLHMYGAWMAVSEAYSIRQLRWFLMGKIVSPESLPKSAFACFPFFFKYLDYVAVIERPINTHIYNIFAYH